MIFPSIMVVFYHVKKPFGIWAKGFCRSAKALPASGWQLNPWTPEADLVKSGSIWLVDIDDHLYSISKVIYIIHQV